MLCLERCKLSPTTNMSADTLKIGHLIETEQVRDAIHVAVVPVTAAQQLLPGQHVSLISPESMEVGYCQPTLGVVDPFLKGPVQKGERFWLFLYPGSITSLRHEWTHPVFDGGPENPSVPPHDAKKDLSREWIERFAASIPLDYNVLMEGAADYRKSGEYLCFGSLLEGESIPDEFWDHYSTVIGEVVPQSERGHFFTCSC